MKSTPNKSNSVPAAKRPLKPLKISAVDLFCGAGGLTRGLKNSGVNVTAGFDIDPHCEYPYTANQRSKYFCKSVEDVTAAEIEELYPSESYRVLAGCAPCQPFSKYTQGKDNSSDKKWSLLNAFSKLATEVKPDVLTMENVPELTRHEIFWDFTDELEDAGYFVTYYKIYCPKYGLPQTRTRLVLFASKFGPVELPEPTHPDPARYKTVKQVINHLPEIAAGKICPTDLLHRSSGMSETNFKRIRASKPGGSWRDWPSELVAKCHQSSSGKGYSSVYGRMEWDKPSPTMTTQCFGFGNGRFGHPEQDRAISLREAALLQTFPENYKFFRKTDQISMSVVGRLIGNAVPVRLGEVIGKAIKNNIRQYAVLNSKN